MLKRIFSVERQAKILEHVVLIAVGYAICGTLVYMNPRPVSKAELFIIWTATAFWLLAWLIINAIKIWRDPFPRIR